MSTITKDAVVALGLALGADARESTARKFYLAAAEYLHGLAGKARTKKADELSTAGVAKKLGITQAAVGDLPDSVRKAAFKSGSTISRFATLAERFPNADPNVSLEVYAKVAANETTVDENGAETKVTDEAATALVAEMAADMAAAGNELSIRAARDFYAAPGTRPAAASQPETVGDRVDWLLSQPTAVAEWVRDNDDNMRKAVSLVDLLLAKPAAEAAA